MYDSFFSGVTAETTAGNRHTEQIVVTVNNILYLERILRETVVYTTDDAIHTTESLDELAKRFKPGTMTRIHRFYMVRLRHFKRFLGDKVLLSDGTLLPVGRTYAKSVKKDLMRYIKQSSQTNF